MEASTITWINDYPGDQKLRSTTGRCTLTIHFHSVHHRQAQVGLAGPTGTTALRFPGSRVGPGWRCWCKNARAGSEATQAGSARVGPSSAKEADDSLFILMMAFLQPTPKGTAAVCEWSAVWKMITRLWAAPNQHTGTWALPCGLLIAWSHNSSCRSVSSQRNASNLPWSHLKRQFFVT